MPLEWIGPGNQCVDLAGEWRVMADGVEAVAMAVPGDVHSALENAGVIPDPYYGRNEYGLRYLADKDWQLSRNFRVDALEIEGAWYLDIDNLDTVASVYINDQLVLEGKNSFQRYRPDVSKALVAGDNEIRVIIHSSIAEAKRLQDAQPFYIPYAANNCPIPNGNMLRKVQCHYGWDWNIALAPLGIYGTVAIRKLTAARIEHVLTRQVFAQDGSVDLIVDVELFADEPGVVTLHMALDGETVRLDCGINEGMTKVSNAFHVATPKLWWPLGSGEQALSTLTVETSCERKSLNIGFRKMELLTDKDEAGSRFAMRVNGREIFCRGANWIPADALFSRTSREKTRDLLQSAADAHMNMIRVWGGGFYEADWFYDLCDELGLMVWQDFMYSCHIYPSTTDFLDEVHGEVTYQTKRLSSHPSIAIWCGDNELVGALTWFEETRANRDRYLVSYDRLNRTVETAMKQANPDLIWWPSSPASGYLDFGDAWHADGSGDMHYWSVWHENKSFSDYRNVKPRFCSEFGFQSYTSMPVIHKYAGPGDMNIASPVMESHQKNDGGNERIAATMFRYFRFPKDFSSFVYLSQIQQGLAIRTAVDYWRSLKPHCMGTIYWQLNDTWPVASWASLDYGGGWKAMHYMVRRFFQPVAVAAIPSSDETEILLSAVNDTLDTVSLKVETWLVDLLGNKTPFATFDAICPADRAETVSTIARGDIPENTMLFWSFSASNGMTGEGHYAPVTYKSLDLKSPGLETSVIALDGGRYEVTVRAAALALYVMVEADCEGRYSDNAFDLCAGESRTITFVPDYPGGNAPSFSTCDLYSCYGG
jgi:beta-mannosidase